MQKSLIFFDRHQKSAFVELRADNVLKFAQLVESDFYLHGEERTKLHIYNEDNFRYMTHRAHTHTHFLRVQLLTLFCCHSGNSNTVTWSRLLTDSVTNTHLTTFWLFFFQEICLLTP